MPRVWFGTLGCKVNQFETEVIEGLFKERGYQVVSSDDIADIYVINTCSVTHLGERKSRQLIRRAVRANPEAVIVVTGCYAQVSPEEVEAIEGVDVIVGTQERNRIVDLAEEAARDRKKLNVVGNIMNAGQFEDIPLFGAPARTRAFLKIQEGCNNFCTYCIIPYARGPLRSRPLESVVKEAAKMVAAGFKEIVLTGIHLGAYGYDMKNEIKLIDAVRGILEIKDLVRLRLGSLESIEVSDELIAIMQDDSRLCPHLHLPLQAGDDRVLLAMNRHYTTAEYRELVRSIQSRVPDIAITTDIIVGFPGETEEMFNNAVAFVDSMDFAGIHVFPYSRRRGTPAAEYPGQVSEEIKKHRVSVMQAMANIKEKAFAAKFIGRQMDVLFEAKTDGMLEGLTGNYMRVYAGGDSAMQGALRRIMLEEQYKDGLKGKR